MTKLGDFFDMEKLKNLQKQNDLKWDLKELIERYHARAIESYKETRVHISPIQHVEITDDGAYVEAMVWIPKEEISGRRS